MARKIPKSVLRSLAVGGVGLLAGLMIGVSAVNAQGHDLRPRRTNNLAQLAQNRQTKNVELTKQADDLKDEIEQLTKEQGSAPVELPNSAEIELSAGMTALEGPAIKVTLTDAPLEVNPTDVDQDALVVHQQDIQIVVNAMWRAGAEAMTIQGQRVISTTAIKCVGNTVVLHGVPYAPPYEIVAIGDQSRIEKSLDADEGIIIYKQYAKAYQLGYQQQRLADYQAPGYAGALPIQDAHPS